MRMRLAAETEANLVWVVSEIGAKRVSVLSEMRAIRVRVASEMLLQHTCHRLPEFLAPIIHHPTCSPPKVRWWMEAAVVCSDANHHVTPCLHFFRTCWIINTIYSPRLQVHRLHNFNVFPSGNPHSGSYKDLLTDYQLINISWLTDQLINQKLSFNP